MPDRPHRIAFSFEYAAESRARTVERSLAREVGEIDDDRSRTALSRDGTTVRIDVAAADPVALRAASNTWLSLATVAERVAATAAPSSRD